MTHADAYRVRAAVRLALLVALICAAWTPAARAATENGDAGELPATAQDLGAETSLDAIDGAIADELDRDVYRLCLSGGGTFSASTVGGTTVDTQLFLLDADARGVYANDDAPGVLGQSTLPAGDPLTPGAAGAFYLAISRFNQDPIDSDGATLFPDVVDTTGPANASAIVGWSPGRTGAIGAYRIALTGAQACPPPDTSAPAIELRAPADGAAYTQGDVILADYSCSEEEGGSGLSSCIGDVPAGEPIDTTSVGPHSFTVDAADVAGNQSSATVNYTVEPGLFDFSGFLPPLADPPGRSRAKAGHIIPVRFSLNGDQGEEVVADGFPRSARVSCDGSEDADPDSATPTQAPRWWDRVHYHPSIDVYSYLWQTDRDWAGSCRQLIVKLSDGTLHRANLAFKSKHHGWWHEAGWPGKGHKRSHDAREQGKRGHEPRKRGRDARHRH